MPAKNIVKQYVENGYYHLYNRGVEKRDIFLDEQDCAIFLHYIKMYLSPPEKLIEQNNPGIRINRFIPLNLYKEIDLLAFTLMPNHFHLEVKQLTKDGITKFMQRLLTGYVMYFNKKYKRVGALFQNIFKAVIIENDNYLLHLSRYIHLNSSTISSNINFVDFSSYPYYLNQKTTDWVKPQEILAYFNNSNRLDLKGISNYKSFIENYQEDSANILEDLTLEDDYKDYQGSTLTKVEP